MGRNDAGDIYLNLKLDSTGFNKQLKGIKGTATKAAKTIAAAFSIKVLANFSKQCLELGSDLQEVQNVVDTTFTSMSGKVNQFARDAIKSYGLSETMAKRYTGTFGAMAKAFNFGEAEAYKMSTTLTGLAGDVASFYNISQDEAYTKLKSVFTGETEALKELGVVMTQSALDQYALANGFGKTTSAMTEQEKVALRYSFVQKQLAAASGDFAKTSGSWANQVRVLSLQFDSLKASIGQGLINILTPVIRWLNLLVEKLVVAAEAFRNFTAALFGKENSQKTQITTTSDGLDTITSDANNATEATNKATEAAKKLKRELAGFDQITKLGSEETSSDTSGTTNGSGGSGTGGSTIITTPETGAASEFDVSKLSEKYTALAESISNLKDKFKTFTDLLADAGKWVYDNVLKPLGSWTMNELAPALIDYFAAALETLTTVCNLLKPVWQWIWDNFLSKMASFVGDAVIAFIEMFTWRLEMLTASFNILAEKIKEIPGKISAIKDDVKKKWDEVRAKITGKVVEFKAKVGTKWSDIKEKWYSLRDRIKGKTVSMKAKIGSKWSDLKSKWNTLLGHFKNKTVSVTLKIAGKVADIKKWFNEHVIDKVNEKIHSIPLLKNVSIPHLAQGGYVKKNTPQLAMIGDNRHYGEIVAPENKLEEMARMAAAGAMGTSPEVIVLLREIVELLKNLDLDVVVDGKSLMALIVRLINQQTKSTGRCPIAV